MFSLFRGAYGEMTRKDEFSVALLGLDGAGKTAYAERLRALFDRHYHCRNLTKLAPTVGLNNVRVPLKDAVLNVWDVGGQAELRSLWRPYLTECHALIFVVDSADAQRLSEVCSTLESIFAEERICHVPLMVLFNKCDLEDELMASDDISIVDSGPSPMTQPQHSRHHQFVKGGECVASVCTDGVPNAMTTEAHGPPSPATTSDCGRPFSTTSPGAAGSSGSGWQSFELDTANDNDADNNREADDASASTDEEDNDWERMSNLTTTNTTSTTTDQCQQQQNPSHQRRDNNTNSKEELLLLMERFRRQYFNNHITTRHQADVAIFSVSALHNTNVKRSATWLISALLSSSSALTSQRHHHPH